MTHDIAAPDPKGSKTGHSGAHGPSWDGESGAWRHARWVEPHEARPDLNRRYVQRGTGLTEAPCLTCGGDEVVIYHPTLALPVVEDTDWAALEAQQRELLKAFYDREARTLTVRFTYLRKGHPRAALEAVLAGISKTVFETEILDEH